MNCVNCNQAFAYTTYIRVMKRSEKTHRSRQTWQAIGHYCVNCGHSVEYLDDKSRRAIMTRRLNHDRQMKLDLADAQSS